MRRLVLVAAACASAVMLAGCSENATGSPQPETNTVTTGKQNPSSTASPKTTTSTSLSAKDPCVLMSTSEATTLGFGPGVAKEVPGTGGLKQCTWKTADGAIAVGVGYGRNSLEALGGEKVEIGKHPAAKLKPDPIFGACPVAIGLPDSTTIIITGTDRAGKDEAVCPKVVDTAKIIDPKLP